MTPEEWVQGLDLPNLLRYADHATNKGFLTTAFREALAMERAEEREAILETLKLLHRDHCVTNEEASGIQGAIACIRARK